MPEYLYQHPATGEVIAVVQKMLDKHEFIDETGLSWKRIFTCAGIGVDSQNVDPFSQQQFLDKTAHMKGTVGDMMDYSKELSQQREAQIGKEDPIKRKTFDAYKKTRGVAHPKDQPKSTSIETSKYRVDF